jgi:hypothetical protein
MAKSKDLKVLKTAISIKLYIPVKDIPETHKPQITFEGKVLSMREMSYVEFELRRALRHFKLSQGKDLTSDNLNKGEDSDGTE